MTWICEDCGWDWPLAGEEPWAWAECDNCGNSEFVEEFEEQPLFAAPHTCSLPVDKPTLAMRAAHPRRRLQTTTRPLRRVTGPEMIRQMRDQNEHWTQADLAARVGVGTPHISKIEAGRERPSAELCHAIAEVLDMDADHLAATFGYLPDWADELLRDEPLTALDALRAAADPSDRTTTENP